MRMRVSVLGAGNGGTAMGFDLASRGVDVLLWAHPSHAKNLEAIRERGGVEALDKLPYGKNETKSQFCGFAPIKRTTVDIEEAISFSDLVLFMVPSFAQEAVFQKALPYLQDKQIVLLLPGNFGSLTLSRIYRESGKKQKVIFAESNSIPFASRVVGPAQLIIGGVKKTLDIASFPSQSIQDVVQRCSDLFPCKLQPVNNVLEIGLSNMNPVIHPATTALNIGTFESRNGQFQFYSEGISASVSQVLTAIDAERISIARGYGLNVSDFISIHKKTYNQTVTSFRDFAVNSPSHNSFGYDAPTSSKHRFVHEDTPYGLVPFSGLASIAKVSVPTIESIIRLNSIYNEIDYFQSGRNLTQMGLEGKTTQEVLELVTTSS